MGKEMWLRAWLVHAALVIVLLWTFVLPVEAGRIASVEPPRDVSEQAVAGRLHPALRHLLIRQAAQQGTACQADETCAVGGEYLPVIVEWRRDPAALSAFAAGTAGADRLAQRKGIVAALQADTERQTAGLRAFLEEAVALGQARNVSHFWASPVTALEAQPALIAALAARDDVAQVRPDAEFRLEEVHFEPVAATTGPDRLPWNLEMLDVGLAQDGLGLDGTGVTVAILDTGVDWQHPALLNQYRGYRGHLPAVHRGNWHVSTDEGYLYPGDGYGHGTHVMGIIVGDDGQGNRIGVAPAARWIAVKVFTNSGYTYESWIHDAFQWIIAPEGDPALAPDVVNCSWGSNIGSDARFRPDVLALRAAGILPIFSAGNQGPVQGSINSPASYPEAFAVGAVDEERRVTNFSSRGPGPWGDIKPEVVAPGANIRSAFPGGSYMKASGTSMAAPHVAGLVALLLQARPHASPGDIAALLRATAQPLEGPVPNNNTGWGLVNAYAASMRLVANGELAGKVVRSNGLGIASPTVKAVARADGREATVTGDTDGAFMLALQPGLYAVTASAFGFEPATQPSVEVIAGQRVSVTLTLVAQPAGVLFGRVTDLATNAPLSATVALAGVPVLARTDPNTGLYSMPLPAGVYTATVTAEGHRIGRFTASIAAGEARQVDISLRSGPRVLLVDSGRWYYDSQIAFFEDALTALDYPYTLWPVRDPFGVAGNGADAPTRDLLARYDLVIWSAPHDAPGLIGADTALTDYLRRGGRLVLSGQDVAFWDAGGSPLDPPAVYLTNQMGLWFAEEADRPELLGVADSPLAGLRLQVNAPDSAGQQHLLDAVAVRRPLVTQPVLTWPDGPVAGVVAGRCTPFRAAWLGFGLEGIGPREARIQALDRLLAHFDVPPANYGLTAETSTDPLIGRWGSIVTQTITLQNIGVADDLVDLRVEGGPWPITVVLPDGQRTQEGRAVLAVPGCRSALLLAEITIPDNLPRNARAEYRLHLASRNDATAAVTVTLAAKTPAAVVLVDDERFYDHEDRFIAALADLDLAFDVHSTQGGDVPPSPAMLQSYPLAIWTTGYDWFQPLSADELDLLAGYLDRGGRLLLSSQDLLDYEQNTAFAAERLGVAASILSVAASDVVGPDGNPLGAELGPWRLRYPFMNWSDGIVPRPTALSLLQDQGQHVVAVAQPADRWRTAFFAFSLEALAPDALATLLGRTLLWLSPLGESRLEAPAFAARGAQVPITLTLGLADEAPRSGVAATLPLPLGLDLVSGSLRGPWQADSTGRALRWTGDLVPGQQLVMTARLAVSQELPQGALLPLSAVLDAGDGIILQARSPIRVDVPWLVLRETGPIEEMAPGSVVSLTLNVTNIGQITATAFLTDTLPKGLMLLPETVQASRGSVNVGATALNWHDVLPPGAEAAIRFNVRVTPVNPRARLSDWAELTDQTGRRVVAWAMVHVRQRNYLPLIFR
ncbi:MAG: S8 family serine peptidase [Anaerolineae bacterium]